MEGMQQLLSRYSSHEQLVYTRCWRVGEAKRDKQMQTARKDARNQQACLYVMPDTYIDRQIKRQLAR